MKWKILNQLRKHTGFFNLDVCEVEHDSYTGGPVKVTRELYYRDNAVAVLLYDPARDKVVMIEQFRIGAINDENGPWLLEIVAGMIKEGETVHEVAKRECKEEAGIDIHAFDDICTFYTSPGGSSEMIYLVCGIVDSSVAQGVHGVAHEGEDIKVVVIDYERVEELLSANEVASAIPLIALQWLKIHRERLRIESFVL